VSLRSVTAALGLAGMRTLAATTGVSTATAPVIATTTNGHMRDCGDEVSREKLLDTD
jgi:hypothetical protein